MKLLWRYDLPTSEQSRDHHFEGPILIKEDRLFFVSCGPQARLHVLEAASGRPLFPPAELSCDTISSRHLMFDTGDGLVIYTGRWYFWQEGRLSPLAIPGGPVLSALHQGQRLYILCRNRGDILRCLDLDTRGLLWETTVSCTNSAYQAGSLHPLGNLLTCAGRDGLVILDPRTGALRDSIKIPRIAKLYCPRELSGGHLLLGYTNWTGAGVLRYDPDSRQVLWRHRRNFEGPQLDCTLWFWQDLVLWVKNGTELICLDHETGEEQYALRTAPWLYTPLQPAGERMLYGTAGADGFLNCLDPATGKTCWSHFLKNGCAWFGLREDSVVIGDFGKTIKELRLADGALLQELAVEGEVVGRVTISGNAAYTILWGDETRDIQLVCVTL